LAVLPGSFPWDLKLSNFLNVVQRLRMREAVIPGYFPWYLKLSNFLNVVLRLRMREAIPVFTSCLHDVCMDFTFLFYNDSNVDISVAI
jgi:hypothetical protein